MPKLQGKNFRFIIKVSYDYVENTDPVFKLDPNSEEREKIYREWVMELIHDGEFDIIDVDTENEEWEES